MGVSMVEEICLNFVVEREIVITNDVIHQVFGSISCLIQLAIFS